MTVAVSVEMEGASQRGVREIWGCRCTERRSTGNLLGSCRLRKSVAPLPAVVRDGDGGAGRLRSAVREGDEIPARLPHPDPPQARTRPGPTPLLHHRGPDGLPLRTRRGRERALRVSPPSRPIERAAPFAPRLRRTARTRSTVVRGRLRRGRRRTRPRGDQHAFDSPAVCRREHANVDFAEADAITGPCEPAERALDQAADRGAPASAAEVD